MIKPNFSLLKSFVIIITFTLSVYLQFNENVLNNLLFFTTNVYTLKYTMQLSRRKEILYSNVLPSFFMSNLPAQTIQNYVV